MNKLVFLFAVLFFNVISIIAADDAESINLANKVANVHTKNGNFRIEIPDLNDQGNLKEKNEQADALKIRASLINLINENNQETTSTPGPKFLITKQNRHKFLIPKTNAKSVKLQDQNSQNSASIVKLSMEDKIARLSAILNSRLRQNQMLLKPREEVSVSTQLRNKLRSFRRQRKQHLLPHRIPF
ncbi:hypothetical protein BpHYR1_028926 [Brachionus plicatilis]|uniref:Uncharacterized protein n=1 Tax=Brachionus plicatilis TaxID=10195 RepID=A0A3M7RSF4_BRAPC|nr:hypothetical protein BpHYR1_028926 [Brachionus plicatilis]